MILDNTVKTAEYINWLREGKTPSTKAKNENIFPTSSFATQNVIIALANEPT